ncbi:MAG TPA: DUF4124 domain-containing protein [Variovorax sp.]|jgi:hypothetical protein
MSLPVLQLARITLMLGLCAASAMASAQIHRCKDDSGQVVLSDRPCGAESSVQPQKSASAGNVVDRLAAPQMHGGRSQESGGQYDFIPDQSGRSRRADKQL